MNAPQAVRSLRYSVEDFVDDERRLLAMHGKSPSRIELTFEEIDGRLRVVDTQRLSRALAHDEASSEVFEKKYGGPKHSAAHQCRCHQVVRFLGRWRDEIVHSGLASASCDRLAIREEFLDYLLNYSDPPADCPLPDDALSGFLDEWGHRWM